MKIPRNIQGDELVKILIKYWGYHLIHQKGSHIILETSLPSHHRLCIPNHNPVRVGTLNSIISAVARHKKVSKQDILNTL
ncbi:MAG: type II toxin-antitoxin system HicA family toxin [Cyanobacterium sp. T60_A2020_053]|nr:type II toxin-antitoxin system HicA family toxin [Cyanobacterium sp. T60_A2020_053]